MIICGGDNLLMKTPNKILIDDLQLLQRIFFNETNSTVSIGNWKYNIQIIYSSKVILNRMGKIKSLFMRIYLMQ